MKQNKLQSNLGFHFVIIYLFYSTPVEPFAYV